MAEKTTYIRIDRNIKNWRWWKDHNTLVVFLELLIDANISEHGFSGQKIRRGQVVTSLQSLCNSTGLTIREVRTAISHLKMTGEVTDKTFPKFRVITIVNYDKYQDLTGKTPYKKTSKRQANDKQATILREEREVENGEKDNSRFAQIFPCGTSERPDWLSEDEWERVKYRSTDNIPGTERGYYDTYIGYLEEEYKKGGKIE